MVDAFDPVIIDIELDTRCGSVSVVELPYLAGYVHCRTHCNGEVILAEDAIRNGRLNDAYGVPEVSRRKFSYDDI